jgi:hypothetical protein
MKQEKDSTIRTFPAEPTTTINGIIRAQIFLLNENKTGTRELRLWVYTLFGWEIMERWVRTIMINE